MQPAELADAIADALADVRRRASATAPRHAWAVDDTLDLVIYALVPLVENELGGGIARFRGRAAESDYPRKERANG